MVGGSKFVSDSSTSADGDSLWVRWSTSRTIEFRMWIWFGDGLYQIAVSTSWRAWIRTSEHLDNLVRHLEPLDPDTIPHEDLPIRLRIHTVAEGETVEALIAQYPDSDVQALELWNGIEPGQPLVPGSRVKVITRSLPTYE
jgi:predicted Zn-dependent protease